MLRFITLFPFLMLHGRASDDKAAKLEAYQRCLKRHKAGTVGSDASAVPTLNNTNIKQGAFSDSAKLALEARRKQKIVPLPADKGEEGGGEPYMRHRLRNCLPFWKTFCQSTLVLSWIANGFDMRWLPETGPPLPAYFHNQRSAFEHSEFVTQAIHKLLEAGSIERSDVQPYLVSALGVVLKKSNGKPRLIFDARFLNSHLHIPSFKYEDLSYCHQYMQPNDHMVFTDYKMGYHHVDIHPDFWKYLGIEWDGNFYTFTSMPFGLATACWAFTKITRELLNKWRRMGQRCSSFIDDLIYCGGYMQLKRFVIHYLLPDTSQCGFLLNDKSVLEPQTTGAHLGMLLDTVKGCFEVPQSKRDIVISLLTKALQNKRHCLVHSLEVLAGNLISMHWAFGPLSRLMTMSIYADIKSAPHRFSYIKLSESSIHDITFWLHGFDTYNGFNPIWESTGFHMTMYTDAAGANLQNFGGWAGWTQSNGKRLIAKGIWTGDIIFDHSTMQELLAIYNTVLSFNRNNELVGKRLLIKTDNQAVFFIINRAGSRDTHVHDLCKKLYWYCIHNRIYIHATWIPRDLNTFADFYSKLTDSGDWKLNPSTFKYLSKRWGNCDIDLFASFDNHQLPKYYSLYFTPTCLGVDAFDFDWGLWQRCWCNPPFSMIARTLAHGRNCGARMCFICPFTPTAPWWPTISPDGVTFAPFIQACDILLRRPNLFLPGKLAHTFANRMPRWHSLALIIDFVNPSSTSLLVPSISNLP